VIQNKRLTLRTVGVLLALLFAALAVPGLGDWLYPLPLVIGLAAALVGSWTYFLWTQRRPSSVDQGRLDTVLRTLSRDAIRRIDAEDFALAWPDDLLDPVVELLRSYGDVEHRFEDVAIERRRAALMVAADRLAETEGHHGYPHPVAHSRRYVGIREHEFDAMTTAKDRELFGLFTERQRAIHRAAGEVVDAYDALVVEARRRRYSLGAIESRPLTAGATSELHGR
jgi:hypothetical protein